MKILTMAVAMAAACALAQEKPDRPHGGMPPRGPMMQQAGPWMVRMLSSKATLDKIGVTDEALRDKLLTALAPLKEQGDEIEKKIRDISHQQAELTRGLFEDKTRDPKPVLDKITEVAKLRAEQGHISVKAFLVLRDNLPPELLEKAKTVIFERGRERGRMRRGEGPGGRRGARGDGEDGERRGPPHGRRGRKGQAQPE